MGNTKGNIKKPESNQPAKDEKKPPAPNQGGAPSHGSSPSTNNASAKASGAGIKLGCNAQGCKAKDTRHSFCDEHFRQFKFGLISKNGMPVSDYEKKLEHYQKWVSVQKVA